MAFKHMGASISKHAWNYPHRAECAYSGNVGTVYSVYENITEQWQQDKLNYEYMMKHCNCNRCTEHRQDRAKVRQALEADGATESLKAMGW